MNPDHIVVIVVAIFAAVSFAALYAWRKTPTFQEIVLKYCTVEEKDPSTEDKNEPT